MEKKDSKNKTTIKEELQKRRRSTNQSKKPNLGKQVKNEARSYRKYKNKHSQGIFTEKTNSPTLATDGSNTTLSSMRSLWLHNSILQLLKPLDALY